MWQCSDAAASAPYGMAAACYVPLRSLVRVMLVMLKTHVAHSCTFPCMKARSSTVSRPCAPVSVTFLQADSSQAAVLCSQRCCCHATLWALYVT
jgi:hypothetical protein